MASLIIFFLTLEILGSIFFFKVRRNQPIEDESKQEHDNLLCKFVSDGAGRQIGESISIDNDILIIKSKERFLGVPLKHIEDVGKTLLVKGLVNLDKAYAMGEKWRQNSFFDLDEEKKK